MAIDFAIFRNRAVIVRCLGVNPEIVLTMVSACFLMRILQDFAVVFVWRDVHKIPIVVRDTSARHPTHPYV
jgi:hypothetical protein